MYENHVTYDTKYQLWIKKKKYLSGTKLQPSAFVNNKLRKEWYSVNAEACTQADSKSVDVKHLSHWQYCSG
jgi:hypothetical protein